MKTSTLRQLVDSLTDVRHYHLASALLESDPERQSRERDQAHQAGAVLDAIRFELSARDARNGRTTDAALHADGYLHRLLADFLGLGDLGEPPRPNAGIASTTSADPRARSGQEHANRSGSTSDQADAVVDPAPRIHGTDVNA